jgi:PEP-CTERM motif
MKFSKIALSVASLLSASVVMATPITVVIDNYNYVAGPSFVPAGALPSAAVGLGPNGATWTWNSISPDSVFNRASTSVGMNGSVFAFSTPAADVIATGTLSYLSGYNYVAVGGTAGTGTFNYTTVTTDLTGTITPVTGAGYVSGAAINLAFNASLTKSWDVSIDQLGVTFECANAAALKPSTTYTSAATYAISEVGQGACGTPVVTVPVPGSLALLGLGGIALGLVARRRSIK